jgi:hypothetical protein
VPVGKQPSSEVQPEETRAAGYGPGHYL